MDNNVLSIRFPDGERFVESEPLHQWDYGIKVVIENVDLPSVYEVHFSNLRFDGTSKTVIGSPDGFVIPQEYLESGRDIQAYIYTHATEDDGETYYHISIPVIKRAKPTDEEPAPTEQSTVEALIARTTQVVSDAESAINNIPNVVDNAIANSVDKTLTISDKPADAKAVGDELNNLKSDLSETEDEIIRTAGVVEELECGLTEEVKSALLACFTHVAWISDDGQTYYNTLSNALNRSRVLSNISAVFTQGSTTIYDTDELYALKQYMTVTATYNDGTTKDVNNYTLNGKLVAGTSTITVTYNKKTTTFNVTVTHQEKTLESISATFSSSAVITTDNVLDDLRPYLTVRASYSDGSTNTITNYTLSGSLNVGTNTITVTYNNKTATFTVNVTQAEKTLQSISAVFNQGSAVIYTDNTLNDLKPYLTVTARYSDSTTQTVTGYTLSGTLTAGTSTITVSYGGKTTQFTVNVVSSSNVLHYPGDNIYLYKQSNINLDSDQSDHDIGYGLVYSYTSQKVTFVSTVGDYPIYNVETEEPMQYYPISIPSEANRIIITPTISENYKIRALAREFSNNRYGATVADTKWQSDTPVTLDLTNAGNNPKYLLITMQGGTSATIGTIDVDALEIEFTV